MKNCEQKRKNKKIKIKKLRKGIEQVKRLGILQQSHFESITKVTYLKEKENLSCKKTPKNKLLNMSTG